MKLSDAVKEIFGRFGKNTITTPQFVNLIADIGGFSEEPAASKKVMKGLLDSGFGKLVFELSETKNSNWQNVIRKNVNDYTSKSGYKDDLINNIASIILFNIGIISELPKLDSINHTGQKQSSTPINDPKELLYVLKQEYLDSLSELITITTNEYGQKFGYFPVDANTKLYILSSKIKLLAQETGELNIEEWLRTEREKIESKNRPTQSQINQAVEDLLESLEREYESLMEKGFIVQDDEFGLKAASFPQNVISDLNGIEKKIIILGKRKNIDKTNWIADKKRDFLTSNSSPASVRSGVLDKLKTDYINRLNQLDKDSKTGDINLQDPSLSDTRRKLINIGTLLGKSMEEWCNTQNSDLSLKRKARAQKKKKRNKLIGIAASIIIILAGWFGILIGSSAEDRKNYEKTMALANTEYDNGNYNSALDLYLQAENDYNSLYSASSYKGEAHKKAINASTQIYKKWIYEVNSLIADNQVVKARLSLQTLPSNLVLDDHDTQEFNSLKEVIDVKLIACSEEFVDELLNEIYTNNGKLSDKSLSELEAMIKVNPDSYWLNFINDKSK